MGSISLTSNGTRAPPALEEQSLSQWTTKEVPVFLAIIIFKLGFLGGSVVKNLPDNAGDARGMGSIPALGRSPREGNGNPFQYPCLGNPRDRGAWLATVHGVANESDTTEHTAQCTQKILLI